VVAVGSAGLVVPGDVSAGPGAAAPVSERHGGSDRYATAVAVANTAPLVTACDVVVVEATSFADGLTAAVFARPVLLTTQAAMPAATAGELVRRAASCRERNRVLNVTLIGGVEAISAAQQATISQVTGSVAVRIGGNDRYATAIAVVTTATPAPTAVIIATGLDFPDALTGGVLAQARNAAIVLNNGAALRADVRAYLTNNASTLTEVYVLGGTTVMPEPVVTELTTLGFNATRLGGVDREATAVAVADNVAPTGPTHVAITNGFDFSDALVAAPYAGPSTPILLVNTTNPGAVTTNYLTTYCATITRITAIGGTTAISNTTLAASVTAATYPTPPLPPTPTPPPMPTTPPTTVPPIDPNTGNTWTARNAAAESGWTSVTWSPERNLFVAVADAGTNRVMTSPDGATWTAKTAAAANNWTSVTWSPEKSLFVAVADSGTNRVMTSPDGATWTAKTAAAANNWTSVTWSPEKSLFVAVAQALPRTDPNLVMTSPDGETWTAPTTKPPASGWKAVTWSPETSLFVAVAFNGTNRVMTSPDGATWTAPTTKPPTSGWRSVAWSPKLAQFVAVASSGTSRVMTSPDGATWTSRTAAAQNNWKSVTWSPELSKFVAVADFGDNRVMTSPDGETWTARTSPTPASSWSSVTWSPQLSKFVAVAYGGVASDSERVMTSP
jgi:putative cell wall-binding protein